MTTTVFVFSTITLLIVAAITEIGEGNLKFRTLKNLSSWDVYTKYLLIIGIIIVILSTICIFFPS